MAEVDVVLAGMAHRDRTPSWLWPGGKIPYIVDESYTAEEKATLKNVMNEWETKTDHVIHFQEIPNPKDYPLKMGGHLLRILKQGNGCNADMGRLTNLWENQAAESWALFAAACLRDRPSMLHELGHVIGLWHEHNRWDRDLYIKVYRKNIRDDSWDGYTVGVTKHPGLGELVGDDIGFYDFESIMHYGYINGHSIVVSTAGSCPQGGEAVIDNGEYRCKVMEPRADVKLSQWAITGISEGDIEAVKFLYSFDIEKDRDIPGWDYADFSMRPGDDHRVCQKACAADVRCDAYTFVDEYVIKNSLPRCYLKRGDIPAKSVARTGMISGRRIKKYGSPSLGVAQHIRYVGANKNTFEIKEGTRPPRYCRELCEKDKDCVAFTFIEPSFKNKNSYCHLKGNLDFKLEYDDQAYSATIRSK